MALEPLAVATVRDPKMGTVRLDWSRWSRCESSFSLALAPHQPGLFVLAEEVLSEGESPLVGRKRMLAVFHVEAADDLAPALSALFRPGALRRRMDEGRIFVRYAVVPDPAQRAAALAALHAWLAASCEAASGISDPMVSEPRPMHHQEDSHQHSTAPPPLPSGF